ncbi:vitelline membrane outer layer protein 1-like [Sceloporus undulatus]|uniref:vitelline membrane outer layer protein 1-like n=1 Tax=Sceloporus undulatus TaxID=8520 RepID=UPI001C4D4FAF|nr:vitelline membrane outer layer protein 1-like [Sceloporus undulatus]
MQPGFSIIGSLVLLLLSCYLWDAEAICCWPGVKERNRKAVSTISVRNGGRWGQWGPKHFCPKGYAIAFSLKVEPFQGILHDDSSLNGIRLHCSDGSVVTSAVGPKGYWTLAKSCRRKNLMQAFRLRVSRPQVDGDDTAANNIQFKCSNGVRLRGKGLAWGRYGKWSKSCKRGICGLQTKVDKGQRLGRVDATGLNDVRFFCCKD